MNLSRKNFQDSERPSSAFNNRFFVRPVAALLPALIFGIGAGSVSAGGKTAAYLSAFAAAGLIIRRLQQDRTAVFLPLILTFSIGYLSIQTFVRPEFPPHHIIHFTDSRKFKISGTVANRPEQRNHRWRFVLNTETLESDGDRWNVTGKIRVSVIGNSPELKTGDRIVFKSKIRAIRNFNNPGRFNYKRYMSFQRIWGSAYVSAGGISGVETGAEIGCLGMMALLVEDIRNRIDRQMSGERVPLETRNVLKALIIGDRNAISSSTREAFNRAGAGHLLAISGLHVGIVAAAAFAIFRKLLSCFSFFLWHAWTRKGAAVLSLIPTVGYGLLAGMTPSTQRAVIMTTVFLLSFLIEKEQDVLNTLAVAAMVILAIFPPALFSISFQLSFSAVLSILLGFSIMGPIQFAPDSRWQGIRKRLSMLFLVSLFAVLGTLPPTMYYFNQISLIGVLSNLILVPLVGMIVVPSGLFFACVGFFNGPAASLGFGASAAVLTTALDILHLVAELPVASVKTFTPSIFEIICYYGFILALAAFVRWNRAIQQRLRKRGCFIFVLIVALVFGGDGLYWLQKRFLHQDLKVTVLDVGQGNAALIEFPGGDCMLLDGGGFSDYSSFDVGRNILAPFLWRKRIMTVNTVVLTHPDNDHIKGLVYIAENFNVERIWTNDQPVDTLGYQKFNQVVQKRQIRSEIFQKLPSRHEINGAVVQILYPPKHFLDNMQEEKWRNTNNNSLVVKISFGAASVLFPGDIMRAAEEELVSLAGDQLKSTILLAPHHGSRSSSTENFLKTVRPDTVIISSGYMNRFHFPHPSVIKRYRQQNCRILNTATDGAIMLSSGGASFNIRPFLAVTRQAGAGRN